MGSVPEDGKKPGNPEARRPADVFLPRWRRGTPLALDFAVTSGLRDIPGSIRDASSAVTSYEGFKRSHLNTERLCSEDGFGFCPMVVEAVGGAWGPSASKVFSELAKAKTILSGESIEQSLKQLYENLGTILQRENARSVIKRLGTWAPSCAPDAVLAAAATLQCSDAGTEQ